MINIYFHSFYKIILTILVIVNFEIAAYGSPLNILNSSGKSISLQNWEIIKDTEPKKPLPTFPDSLWQVFDSKLDVNLYSEGNWILRTYILITDSISNETLCGLFPTNFVTAYEIYWDGIKIGQNGIIGINKTDERAGTFNYNLGLSPDLITIGKHTIIIRLSNYHSYSSWKWFYGELEIGHYDSVLKKLFRSGYHAFFIMGILFIAFLFNLFLYITRKRKIEHLLFSLICFFVMLDFVIFQSQNFFDFPTTFVHFKFYFYQINTMLFTILFPTFFIYSFSLPKKYIGIVLLTNLILFIFFINGLNVFTILSLSVLILSSVIALRALTLRREGSLVISIGLVLSWIAFFFNLAFEGLATVMVVCTSFSIAQQFARKEKAEKEAQLRSANLEIELLKKNINPHFVLNTLTSIIVWLRKDSNSAIKLIEALAEEFRMINQISALKQIPISQEIDLCKAHLKIMSYRKGAEYKLETIDIDEKDNIPPMIFHTLIENGLTHGYENKSVGTFKLQRILNSESIKYILTNDGDFNSEDTKGSTGFGAKYVKGRLEENYPNKWKFISNKTEQGWESMIEIRNR